MLAGFLGSASLDDLNAFVSLLSPYCFRRPLFKPPLAPSFYFSFLFSLLILLKNVSGREASTARVHALVRASTGGASINKPDEGKGRNQPKERGEKRFFGSQNPFRYPSYSSVSLGFLHTLYHSFMLFSIPLKTLFLPWSRRGKSSPRAWCALA